DIGAVAGGAQRDREPDAPPVMKRVLPLSDIDVTASAGRLRPPELSAALRKSARSLPAENAPGTPAISTQRTESSAFAPSSAAVTASYMASVSAFFLSGRFIRMVRMPSASVTITCSVIKCIRFLYIDRNWGLDHGRG